MHYAFTPCYLNLAKGSGVEYDVAGENDLGLHGNAILSRYPLRNIRAVALKNGKDKMKGREKRLGRQTAVVAEVEFPQGLGHRSPRCISTPTPASRTAAIRCGTCSTASGRAFRP